jgi:hypothetical protein
MSETERRLSAQSAEHETDNTAAAPEDMGTAASVEASAHRAYPLLATARTFFLLAVAITVVAAPYLYGQTDHSHFLVIIGALLGALGFGLSPWIDERAQREHANGATNALLERWATLAIFAAFLALYASMMFPPSPFDEELRQAVAFLHGHVAIDAPKSFIEHAQVGPYSYALHPPLPAILMMPLAAIWGMATDQTEFSVVVGAIDIALAWVLLGRLTSNLNVRLWLTLFFGLGNVLWYESLLGTTWAVPMNTAVLFTLLALIELYGEMRPVWLGVFAALACLARYDMVLAVPSYAAIAWSRGHRISELFWIVPPFLVAGAIFIGLNEVRYHNFFDVGVLMVARDQGYSGAFGFKYFPGNFYTLFFMAPSVNGTFPYIHPGFGGQALTLTSPAFVLALRPSFKRLEVAALGIAAALISIPSLFHFTNGFAQFGTRFYITTFPLLLVMMALEMRRRTDQLAKILIVASIVLVSFGIWHVRMYGFN